MTYVRGCSDLCERLYWLTFQVVVTYMRGCSDLYVRGFSDICKRLH